MANTEQVKKIPKKEPSKFEQVCTAIWNMTVIKIKNGAFKWAMQKILGNALAVGFNAWIVKVGFNLFWKYFGRRVVQLATRKGLLFYDRARGAIRYKKLEHAKESGDEQSYNEAIDDA